MSTLSVFAPGRLELLGNHTDYNEGLVLSCAIDRGIYADGDLAEDGTVELVSSYFPDRFLGSLDDSLKPSGKWYDYPLGVAWMMRKMGLPIGGFKARFRSTLPPGSGLSSSAAIEIATGCLLAGLFQLPVDPMDMAKWCRQAENEFVGVNCGLLDQVSSMFGQKGKVVYLDCRSESIETFAFPRDCSLLITNSGVKHALTGGEYNERREQCYQAAELMGVRALRDVTFGQVTASNLPPQVKYRALHVTGEIERVQRGVQFLQRGDADNFGALMSQSHTSSRINFENSILELDELVEIALAQEGVYGSRLTGGGFGGATVSLVATEHVSKVSKEVVAEYQQRTGLEATTLVCRPGSGALEIMQQAYGNNG